MFILAQQAHLIWSLLVLIKFQAIDKASCWAINHPGLQSATCLPSAQNPTSCLPKGNTAYLRHPSSSGITQKSRPRKLSH